MRPLPTQPNSTQLNIYRIERNDTQAQTDRERDENKIPFNPINPIQYHGNIRITITKVIITITTL